MATIPEALTFAIRHHQAGRLHAAEQIYRQILAVEPNHADAWHLLGAIAFQAGAHGMAVEYIQRAIALDDSAALFHSNLGAVAQDKGKLDEAVASFRRALRLRPDYAVAQHNLGVREVAQRFPVVDLGSRLDEASGAFMDTAAVMRSLDLVAAGPQRQSLVSDDAALPAGPARRLAGRLPQDRRRAGRANGHWQLESFRRPGLFGVRRLVAAFDSPGRCTPAKSGDKSPHSKARPKAATSRRTPKLGQKRRQVAALQS